MPRKSSRTPVAETEKRVTRRSLRSASEVKAEESPAKASPARGRAAKAAPSPAREKMTPSPQPKGRGRGSKAAEKKKSTPSRGRGKSPRGRKPKKEESEEEEEEEDEEEITQAPTAAGDAVGNEEEEEEEPAAETSSRRPRRAAASSPKKKPERTTPRRGRQASKAKDYKEVEEDEDEEPEEPEPTPRRKRKHEETKKETGAQSKRQKVETEKENPEEATKEEDVAEPMEAAKEKDVAEPVEATKEKDVAEPIESTKEKDVPEPMEAAPNEEAKPEAKAEETPMETESEETPATAEASAASHTEAQGASDVPVQQAEAAAAEKSQQESEPVKEAIPQPIIEEVSSDEVSQDEHAEEKGSTAKVQEADKEPDTSDYVMVEMSDVPAVDSSQVTEALPKHKPASEEAAPPTESETVSAVQESTATSSEQPAAVAEETPAPEPQKVPSPPEATPDPPAQNSQSASSESSAAVENNSSSQDAPPTVQSTTQEPPATNGEHPTPTAEANSISSHAASANSVHKDPLFARQFVCNPSAPVTDPSRAFSVVSYNILADCHAQQASQNMPWITQDILSEQSRHNRLMQEFQYLDADVLCLQEVSPTHFSNLLQPALKELGYEGTFIKRTDEHFDEGEATFYKTSRFTSVDSKSLCLNDLVARDLEAGGLEEAHIAAVKSYTKRPTVMIITQLKCNNTGIVVTIGNIHVSHDRFQYPDLQCVQAACAIREVVAAAGGSSNPHVLVGDFNSWPETSIYQLATEGYLNDESMKTLQAMPNVTLADGTNTSLVNLWWKGFQHTSNKLKSAYATVLGKETPTSLSTSSKAFRIVDYIWTSGHSLDVAGVLRTSEAKDLEPGIPNSQFPSDHLSLKAQLLFR